MKFPRTIRLDASDLKLILGAKPEMSAMTTDLDGNIYIGNRVDSRISVFDWRRRDAITSFGALGQSRAQYLDITYLSVNSSGQLAVVDKRNEKVEVFQLEQTSTATPVASSILLLSPSV